MTAYATAPLPSYPTRDDREVGFLRGPFAGSTYREIGYTITSLPVAVIGFAFAVTLFAAGAGLAVTVLGLPVLAAMLAGARGLGAVERERARLALGLAVEGPAPVVGGGGFWAAMRARLGDAAGWKALLFHVVMLPYRIFSFVMSVTFLTVGWAVALLPVYNWVFPKYVGDWEGYRVYDYTSGGIQHTYDITSPLQLAAVSLVGLAVVFLTPKLVRALTNVDRAAVRGLLGK
ncbi:sensor domain-containing protein [Streptomyces sp. NBC_00237]|uniref:sensor domain-containing protein n=1 Tax=Streptomyces sp. NBC_00237 TaxID=2975687 RepID=UPI00224EC943|nr:sensor domain-containing protein [Streptomyces sp. NBC_00237]MCX5199912.1 sensor domain-containing protein [Streptomyces sp. NBC_00237]